MKIQLILFFTILSILLFIIMGSKFQEKKTPVMGWNSYDAYGSSINETEVMANAKVMHDLLLPHGYDTIVIDARWYDSVLVNDDREFNTKRAGAKLEADAFGRLFPPTNRFPSAAGGLGFKPLADQLHAMGLKFGIHIMRGIPRQAVLSHVPIKDSGFNADNAGNTQSTCGWCPDMYGAYDNAAGQAWYDSLFKLYAAWGVDFVKVDDLSHPYYAPEIEMIHRAITKCGRKIVFSTSPGSTDPAHAAHIATYADMWRISGDFWDQWSNLGGQFDLMSAWQGKAVPGHWPDADMIPLGHIGLRNWINAGDRMTRLTHDEQCSLFAFWCLAPSPLILGMSLTDIDKATLEIITNDEILAVDQDADLKQAVRLRRKPDIWIKPLADGTWALGVFNRSYDPLKIEGGLYSLGFTGVKRVRDLWLHNDLNVTQALDQVIPPHACVLLKVKGSWNKPDFPPTPTPTGRIYEAEQADLSGGAVIATDHQDYSGSGFVAGYYQGYGQSTLFRITSDAKIRQRVILRYSNGMGSIQTLTVRVNGVTSFKPQFPQTEGWEDWAVVGFTLDLKAGNNTVEFVKQKGDGCVNLDYLAVQ